MVRVRSLVNCEFSEDEFQALAFAELATRFRGVAVGGPFIEDRRAERRHGVDAWIRIQQSGRLIALFLQYKIPKLVISPSLEPATSSIYNGPYLRFKLHQDSQDRKAGAADLHRQHNNLVRLRGLTGQPAYYCAPTYFEWGDLLRAFYRGDIYHACLLGDPNTIGYIFGRETHHITYAVDLSKWAFQSQPKHLGAPTAWDAALTRDTQPQHWTAQDLMRMADGIEGLAAEGREPREPDDAHGQARGLRDEDGGDGPATVLRLARATDGAVGGAVIFVPEPGPD